MWLVWSSVFLFLNPWSIHLPFSFVVQINTVSVTNLCGRKSTPGIQFPSAMGSQGTQVPGGLRKFGASSILEDCVYRRHNRKMQEDCPLLRDLVKARQTFVVLSRWDLSLLSTAAITWNWLEMQIPRPHPWPIQEIWRRISGVRVWQALQVIRMYS